MSIYRVRVPSTCARLKRPVHCDPDQHSFSSSVSDATNFISRLLIGDVTAATIFRRLEQFFPPARRTRASTPRHTRWSCIRNLINKLEKYVRRIWQSGSSMGMGRVLQHAAEVLRCQANALLPSFSFVCRIFYPFLSFIHSLYRERHGTIRRGWGYPKSRQKEGRLHDSACDKWGGDPQIRTFCGRHMWMVPIGVNKSCLSRESAV